MSLAEERRPVDALITVPGLMAEVAHQEGEIEHLAREIAIANQLTDDNAKLSVGWDRRCN